MWESTSQDISLRGYHNDDGRIVVAKSNDLQNYEGNFREIFRF